MVYKMSHYEWNPIINPNESYTNPKWHARFYLVTRNSPNNIYNKKLSYFSNATQCYIYNPINNTSTVLATYNN